MIKVVCYLQVRQYQCKERGCVEPFCVEPVRCRGTFIRNHLRPRSSVQCRNVFVHSLVSRASVLAICCTEERPWKLLQWTRTVEKLTKEQTFGSHQIVRIQLRKHCQEGGHDRSFLSWCQSQSHIAANWSYANRCSLRTWSFASKFCDCFGIIIAVLSTAMEANSLEQLQS